MSKEYSEQLLDLMMRGRNDYGKRVSCLRR